MKKHRGTYVSQLFRSRLQAMGIGEGQLKQWVRDNRLAVPRDYVRLWDCLSGQKTAKDEFIVRIAQCLEIDEAYAALSAPVRLNLRCGVRPKRSPPGQRKRLSPCFSFGKLKDDDVIEGCARC